LIVERLKAGLTNILLRVDAQTGPMAGARVVRIHARGRAACMHELVVLRALRGRIPVPEVEYADPAWSAFVYPWIEGITLNACRLRDPAAFAAVAEQLGALVRAIGDLELPLPLTKLPATVDELRNQVAYDAHEAIARQRIAPAIADRLVRIVDDLPWQLEVPRTLVHGDLATKNVIVDPARREIAAIIDWEHAARGWPEWDIGKVFRYAERYDDAFRAAFVRGHGALTGDWYRRGRLLDATRQLNGLIASRHEHPWHDEARALIAGVVAEH
jgi:aminoglycoside phosphotransferase (APT) family kinase protein